MKRGALVSALLCCLVNSVVAAECSAALNVWVRPLADTEPVNLCEQYGGKVILIVNTASRCAFTPQYEGLEALYKKYKAQGLVVLGFPSNDFGGQEPGTERQIRSFCRLTYAVQFPMFEKTRAAQSNADPLYRALGELAGEYPRWNFHKYLLDREGRLMGNYSSSVRPNDPQLIRDIERLL